MENLYIVFWKDSPGWEDSSKALVLANTEEEALEIGKEVFFNKTGNDPLTVTFIGKADPKFLEQQKDVYTPNHVMDGH